MAKALGLSIVRCGPDGPQAYAIAAERNERCQSLRIQGRQLKLLWSVEPKPLKRLARVTGLEPATSGVTGRHSNRLSYTRALTSTYKACSSLGRWIRGSFAGVKRGM